MKAKHNGRTCSKSLKAVYRAGTMISATCLASLLPLTVLAADECGPGPVVECNDATYADGISYSSPVDLSVSKTSAIVTTVTNNGINLIGTGNASVTWDSAAGGVTGGTGTAGPVLDVLTEDGDIDIVTGAITGTAASVTHGIRAISIGAGDIDVENLGDVRATNATTGNIAMELRSAGGDIRINADAPTARSIVGDEYGILAETSGVGGITVDVWEQEITAQRLRGVAAIDLKSGTGLLTVNVHDGRLGQINGGAGTAIRTNAGGDAVINIFENALNNSVGGRETDETLRFGVGAYAVDMTAAAGTTTTLNIGRKVGVTINESESAETALRSAVLAGRGAGRIVVNNLATGRLHGGVDFSQNSGGVTINNMADPNGGASGGWAFFGNAVRLGSGDDAINNDGLLLPTAGRNLMSGGLLTGYPEVFRQTTIAFGGGQDTFVNAGTMVIGDAGFRSNSGSIGLNYDGFGNERPELISKPVASELVLQDVETFNNSGLIVLGGWVFRDTNDGPRFFAADATGDALCRQIFRGVGLAVPPPNGFPCLASPLINDTDLLINDVLSAPGASFTGSGDSTFLMNAAFGFGVAQRNCQDRVGGEDVFYRLPGADCVDFRGGSTAGSTQIIVRDALPGDQGAYNLDGIVIVDVSGGQSAAEHFTLSPASDSYRETAGGRGVIDKGLFVFPLVYDADTQQHKLVGIPGASALQLPLLTHAAQSLARQVTASGLDERAQNVRAGLRSGSAVNGGFWGEFGQGTIERDAIQPMTAAGETLLFNNDYEQDSSTMILGGDVLISNGDKTAWLLGGSIGYARTELSFTESGNRADLEGVILGLHGGYQTGNWFLNAGYSQSFLQVDDYVPTFNLSTDGSGADTKAQTQSLRIDGGRRFSLTDALHIEPLASIAWIKADFDDLVVASPDNPLATSNTAKFGNAVSLRGALGARLGFDQALSKLRIGYALTGRYWNEFDGQTDVRIASTGPEARLSDTFDDSFLDLAGRISVSDANGLISGYLDATSVSGDDYSSLGFSAGFRYQW